MEPFYYKKKSTTLKNQDFINYSEKIVEILTTIDPVLAGKSCWTLGYGCTIAPFSSIHIDAWLRNWLQSSKVLIQIQHSRY